VLAVGNTAPRPALMTRWSVVLACGLVATGPGLLLGVLVARLWPGLELTGWRAVTVIAVVGGAFTFVAGLVSEPLVSHLQGRQQARRDTRA
jgi:hypothetical protein